MPVIDMPVEGRSIAAAAGENLLDVLKRYGIYPETPCGGHGKCGKCKVLVDGIEVPACKTSVDRDMTVVLPRIQELQILQESIYEVQTVDPLRCGDLLAFDIGTTSIVCFLLDGKTGKELAKSSMRNPQAVFGADVIARIQAAIQGEMEHLSDLIRRAMTELIRNVCDEAGVSPENIGVVSVVGNPAMQQFLLGIVPDNLARIPFKPALTEAKTVPCAGIIPVCPNAELLIVPDISGYIGADTVGCILSTGLYKKDEITLLVDIGTNGEMVLGNRNRMVACSAAAGPALEGGNIRFGMCGTAGAIDHVWVENGGIKYSVIGGGEGEGICGSGIVDAVAVGLKLGQINCRGRIQTEDRSFHLTEKIYLTQDDIRQVQLAKGAICAGIKLMAKRLGLEMADIQKVQLSGAFGSFLNPENACRIGLIPEELYSKIETVGNAAGAGSKMLACEKRLLPFTRELTEKIEFLELANLPEFSGAFARAMGFQGVHDDFLD